MENPTSNSKILPSKRTMKFFLIWLTINLLVLFFTYTELGKISYRSQGGAGVAYDKEIWLINGKPEIDEFWPFISKWKYSSTIGSYDYSGSTKTAVYDEGFYGIFCGYDITEFLVYILGFALLYFIAKFYKHLSK